jgi:hypothetical protein
MDALWGHRRALLRRGAGPGSGRAPGDAGASPRAGSPPAGAGTLRTDSLTFAAILTAVIVVVVVLNFLPALAIGPLAGELAAT